MFPEYKKFLKSADWRNFRQEYIDRRVLADGGLCEVCCQVAGQELHHVKPVTPDNFSDKSIKLGNDNVKWVCKECHSRNEKSRVEKYANPPFKLQNGCYMNESGDMVKQRIAVVWGAPFAGKRSYVSGLKGVADFVLCTDELFKAFSLLPSELLPDNLFRDIMKIRDSILSRIGEGQINAPAVWIIAGLPRRKDREELRKRFPDAEFVLIDTAKSKCLYKLQQSKDVKEKYKAADYIAKYFEKYEPD